MGTDKTKMTSSGGKRAASTGKRRGRKAKPLFGIKGVTGWKKVLLVTLMVIATIMLSLYIAYSVTVVPPDISETPIPTSPSAAPTSSPDTSSDGVQAPSGQPGGGSDSGSSSLGGRRKGVYTVLLSGHNHGLTDVLMLAVFDTVNCKVDVLSIPRDTFSDTKSRSVRKINGAYNTGGMEQLLDEVERLVGIRPDNYVMVDYDGFIELIDAIGGVDFDVPMDMFHRDDNGKTDINLKKGYQHLDGYNALGLCRYRSGYAAQDLGRISTAQSFLKAAAKKAVSTISLQKITEFVNIYSEYVDTDLSVGNIAWFLQTVWQKVDPEDGIQFCVLPVEGGSFNGGSYVFGMLDDALELINSTVNPYNDPITADKVSMLTRKQAQAKYGS